MANEDFFIMCQQVCSVWQSIKEVIYALEANEAILADCFVYLIKLAIAIKCLPEINTFKTSTIYIFNRRYEEFLHPLYILVYYIYPQYRGIVQLHITVYIKQTIFVDYYIFMLLAI